MQDLHVPKLTTLAGRLKRRTRCKGGDRTKT
jgi:hypothetical protein